MNQVREWMLGIPKTGCAGSFMSKVKFLASIVVFSIYFLRLFVLLKPARHQSIGEISSLNENVMSYPTGTEGAGSYLGNASYRDFLRNQSGFGVDPYGYLPGSKYSYNNNAFHFLAFNIHKRFFDESDISHMQRK